MMLKNNFGRELARYARKLENPKYYARILDILENAEKCGYVFKKFNKWDLLKISSEIASYYEAVKTDAEDRRIIRYLNSDWFVVSDDGKAVFSSPSFLKAAGVFLRAKMIVLRRFLGECFCSFEYIEEDMRKLDLALVRGGLRAQKVCGCDVWEMWKEENGNKNFLYGRNVLE